MDELIKKSDAIEAIKDNSFALGDDYMEINGYAAIDDIRALPSADRPRGEWIDDGSYYYWRCSNCNELSCCRSKFCGGCGCRMKGADDEDKD